MNKHLAFAGISIKSYDEELREFEGVATHISPDKVMDVVEPSGAEFKLPLPFLSKHKHDMPVGKIIWAKVEKDGIRVRGQLPKVSEPGLFKDRVDEAWHELKYLGDTMGLSIGFAGKEYDMLPSGGIHFKKWRWDELSLVTVPCHGKATIEQIKSAYAAEADGQAATGTPPADEATQAATPARAMGKTTIVNLARAKGTKMSKLQTSLKGYQDALDAKKAERTETVTKSLDEGRTATADEKESIDTLTQEIKSLEDQIEMVKGLIAADMQTLKPVDGTTEQKGIESRTQAPAVISVRGNEKPGIGFAKFALSMFAGKGEIMAAKGFAESMYGNDKRLQGVMKAAVAAGTTTSPTWAGNLVDYQNMTSEFLEYLRPRTILGQFGNSTVGGVAVPSLRRVPFNVRIPGKTTAGVARWVGETARKPVTASGYEATTLGWSKIAAISVVSDELIRFADPSILELVRDDLTDAVIERMDVDFIDPTKAAGTGVALSPASITNGVTPIASTGNDAEAVRNDISALWAAAEAANMPTGTPVYITDVKTARAVSMMQNPLGQPAFASMTPQGGSINGVPVIVSNYVPQSGGGSMFILAFASEIYLADDGAVNIAYSREATIVMDDDPTAAVTPAMLMSMFQQNAEAIRAERYIHWKKRRPQAVAFLNAVKWGQPVTP